MKQRTTVLVARQDDLSRVYEARKQRVTYKKNPVTLLTTENYKFKGWINGIVKLIENQKKQMENNNEESMTTISITSLENNRVEITIFLLIHNFIGSTNGSASPTAAIVPAPAAGGCCYEDRGTAHAWKITASLINQSESLWENWSTPTKLEDLQWTDRPIEESFRRHFLESFTRYNEILRAHGNYYAARTSRYTTIQSRLTPCIVVPYDKRKRQVVEDPRRSLDSKRLKDSQAYRIIVADEKSSDNVTLSEVENLLKENELLGRALRKAADLHLSMLTEAEATLKEKERLAEERQALENERRELEESRASALKENERLTEERRNLETANQELQSQKEELKRSSEKASKKLRKKERQLEETRRGLDLERQKFTARREVFEKFNVANSSSLREEIITFEDQRRILEQDIQNLAERDEELEEQRRHLERDSSDLSAQKIELRRSSEASASKLRTGQQELNEQREIFRQQETASAASWREKEASLAERRRVLEQFEEELLAKKRVFEEYYENRNDNLREREESLEAQQRRLQRDRRQLSAQEEELRAQLASARSTPPTVIVQKDDGIKIPIIPEILSWHIKLPW